MYIRTCLGVGQDLCILLYRTAIAAWNFTEKAPFKEKDPRESGHP
jgi:hypothetical protein